MTRVSRIISSNFEENTRYAVRVRTINSLGVSSDWSEAISFITTSDENLPDTPSEVSLSGISKFLILRWNSVDINDLSHYEIYITTGSGEFTPTVDQMILKPAGDISAVISKYWNGLTYAPLQIGQTYAVKMRAVDISGNSSLFSLVVSATVPGIVDSDIISISPSKINDGTLTADLTFNGTAAFNDVSTFNNSVVFDDNVVYYSGTGRMTSNNLDSGTRFDITNDGVKLYQNMGTVTVLNFDISDDSFTLQTAGNLDRYVKLSSANADRIEFYEPGGFNRKSFIRSFSSYVDLGGGPSDLDVAEELRMNSITYGTANVESFLSVGNYTSLSNPIAYVNMKAMKQTGTSTSVNYNLLIGWGSLFYSSDESDFTSGTIPVVSGVTANYVYKTVPGVSVPANNLNPINGYPSGNFWIQTGFIENLVANASGESMISLPRAFPNGILSVVATNVSLKEKAKFLVLPLYDSPNTSESSIGVHIYDTATDTTAVSGSSLNVSWIAIGW